MWEALSVALSCLGFAAAVAVLVVELPAILEQMRVRSVHRHHHQF